MINNFYKFGPLKKITIEAAQILRPPVFVPIMSGLSNDFELQVNSLTNHLQVTNF